MYTEESASRTELSAQTGVKYQRWGTEGLSFPTCAEEMCLWPFESALVWLSHFSSPEPASLHVSSCLHRSLQCCQHLKQHMLSL